VDPAHRAVVFTLSVVAYAVSHGVHGVTGGGFRPSYVSFIALVPILAILLVLPTKQVTSLGGFLDAIKAVFTVYGGSVAASGAATLTGLGALLGGVTAAAFVFALLSSGATWVMGADRAEAIIAALDGAGPRWLGFISPRFGTPVWVNIMTGVLSTVVMVLAFLLAGGNADKYFAAVLGLTISTTMLSYIGIFSALAKLRYSHPDVARPYRVPGGKPGAGGVGPDHVWVVLASVSLVWPGLGVGWFGTAGRPDDSLPAGFTRSQFEVSQVGPLVALAMILRPGNAGPTPSRPCEGAGDGAAGPAQASPRAADPGPRRLRRRHPRLRRRARPPQPLVLDRVRLRPACPTGDPGSARAGMAARRGPRRPTPPGCLGRRAGQAGA